MTDPFYDWRNPAKPCAWFKDYMYKPHVVAANQAITHWNEGMITLRELMYSICLAYEQGYNQGLEDAHYSVPAIQLPATYHPLTGWSVWQYANEQDQD